MGYSKQNFQNGQKLKAEHLNHIEDGLAGAIQRDEVGKAGGVAALDDEGKIPAELIPVSLKAGKGVRSILWDGNTSGKVYKGVTVNSMPRYFVKVSDEILTPEDVNGAEHEFIDATESKQFNTVDTSSEDFHAFDNGWYFDTNLTTIAVAYEPNFTALAIKEGEVVLPEAGTYFLLHYYKAANLPNMYTTRLTYFRDAMLIDEGVLPKIPSILLPKAAAVANTTNTSPKKAEFNALLKALRDAGYLAT